tara:strand:+ start:157 stop:978 length:822 start_codon:yes stop_codon:yes gene_type:complete
MTLSLNTNVAASKAALHLAKNQENLNKSLDRLSSGKRITSAADDAGGLAVAMKMEANVSSLKAGVMNMENALSFLQVQDDAMNTAQDIISRMIELNASTGDPFYIEGTSDDFDAEIVALKDQLVALEGGAFNGQSLFGGTQLAVSIDGVTANNITIKQEDLQTALGAAYTATTMALLNGTATTAARKTALDGIMDLVSPLRGSNAGMQSRIQGSIKSSESQIVGLQGAIGRIMDVDIASESANLAKQQILVQASASMVAQANSVNNAALLLLQ